MTNPAAIREIQRLMDDERTAICDYRANELRIAVLLGIDFSAPRQMPDANETRRRPHNEEERP